MLFVENAKHIVNILHANLKEGGKLNVVIEE